MVNRRKHALPELILDKLLNINVVVVIEVVTSFLLLAELLIKATPGKKTCEKVDATWLEIEQLLWKEIEKRRNLSLQFLEVPCTFKFGTPIIGFPYINANFFDSVEKIAAKLNLNVCIVPLQIPMCDGCRDESCAYCKALQNYDTENVIYKLLCSYGKSYIGKTETTLKQRINGHSSSNEKRGTMKKHIAEHQNGDFNLVNVAIINIDDNVKRLKIKEGLFIYLGDNSFNERNEANGYFKNHHVLHGKVMTFLKLVKEEYSADRTVSSMETNENNDLINCLSTLLETLESFHISSSTSNSHTSANSTSLTSKSSMLSTTEQQMDYEISPIKVENKSTQTEWQSRPQKALKRRWSTDTDFGFTSTFKDVAKESSAIAKLQSMEKYSAPSL